MIGHLNPHCRTCGKTAMQIARAPLAPCRRITLPFDEPLRPAKADLPRPAKDQASGT